MDSSAPCAYYQSASREAACDEEVLSYDTRTRARKLTELRDLVCFVAVHVVLDAGSGEKLTDEVSPVIKSLRLVL